MIRLIKCCVVAVHYGGNLAFVDIVKLRVRGSRGDSVAKLPVVLAVIRPTDIKETLPEGLARLQPARIGWPTCIGKRDRPIIASAERDDEASIGGRDDPSDFGIVYRPGFAPDDQFKAF